MSERGDEAQERQEPRSLVIPATLTVLGILGMLSLTLDRWRTSALDGLFVSLWLVTAGFAAWLAVQFTRRVTLKGAITRPRRIFVVGMQLLVILILLVVVDGVLPVPGRLPFLIYVAFAPSLLVLATWFVINLIRGKTGKSSDQQSN